MRVIDSESIEPTLVHSTSGHRIWIMDSIAFASSAQAGDVIVTGSHGGTSAGEYAVEFGVSVVVCSDAGIGKNSAGVAGLSAIDTQGIAGVAVGHDSARIGDGTDIWENGTITYVNATAEALGIRVGAALSEQILALVDERTH